MEQKLVYICDRCKKPVEKGHCIHGNIDGIDNYEISGGFVGNNFPTNPDMVTSIFAEDFFGKETFTRKEIIVILGKLVQKSVYCNECMHLNIKKPKDNNEPTPREFPNKQGSFRD